MATVRVAVRLRPPSGAPPSDGAHVALHPEDQWGARGGSAGEAVCVGPPPLTGPSPTPTVRVLLPPPLASGPVDNRPAWHEFPFRHTDAVLPRGCSQSRAYDGCAVAEAVQRLVTHGESATVVVAGTRGAGRSYTLMGEPGSHRARGILPRAVSQLMAAVCGEGAVVGGGGVARTRTTTVSVTAVGLHCGGAPLRDLLAEGQPPLPGAALVRSLAAPVLAGYRITAAAASTSASTSARTSAGAAPPTPGDLAVVVDPAQGGVTVRGVTRLPVAGEEAALAAVTAADATRRMWPPRDRGHAVYTVTVTTPHPHAAAGARVAKLTFVHLASGEREEGRGGGGGAEGAGGAEDDEEEDVVVAEGRGGGGGVRTSLAALEHCIHARRRNAAAAAHASDRARAAAAWAPLASLPAASGGSAGRRGSVAAATAPPRLVAGSDHRRRARARSAMGIRAHTVPTPTPVPTEGGGGSLLPSRVGVPWRQCVLTSLLRESLDPWGDGGPRGGGGPCSRLLLVACVRGERERLRGTLATLRLAHALAAVRGDGGGDEGAAESRRWPVVEPAALVARQAHTIAALGRELALRDALRGQGAAARRVPPEASSERGTGQAGEAATAAPAPPPPLLPPPRARALVGSLDSASSGLALGHALSPLAAGGGRRASYCGGPTAPLPRAGRRVNCGSAGEPATDALAAWKHFGLCEAGASAASSLEVAARAAREHRHAVAAAASALLEAERFWESLKRAGEFASMEKDALERGAGTAELPDMSAVPDLGAQVGQRKTETLSPFGDAVGQLEPGSHLSAACSNWNHTTMSAATSAWDDVKKARERYTECRDASALKDSAVVAQRAEVLARFEAWYAAYQEVSPLGNALVPSHAVL